MNKRPAPLAWVFFICGLVLMACGTDQSSKVFETHLTDYPDIRKKYIYQSVLRLANIKDDPEFDKLIKDVRKITIYLPPKEDSTYQITTLRSSMRSAGYEELIDVRTADKERISLWVNESLSKPHYVGLLDAASEDYIFEIDGMINLEYISSITTVDQGSLRDLLN